MEAYINILFSFAFLLFIFILIQLNTIQMAQADIANQLNDAKTKLLAAATRIEAKIAELQASHGAVDPALVDAANGVTDAVNTIDAIVPAT